MAETNTASPKSARLKTMIIIAAVLLVEAAAVVGIMLVVGRPSDVRAEDPAIDLVLEEGDKIIEILVLDTRLPNSRSGLTYLYDTEIYVQVRKKHADRVIEHLEQFQNEIKSEIAAIWKTSEPDHFKEPKLENLKRKVYALLNERFGPSEDDDGPIIQKVVIIMGTGLRLDG
jgi:flagellar basal body-associated protein FliL